MCDRKKNIIIDDLQFELREQSDALISLRIISDAYNPDQMHQHYDTGESSSLLNEAEKELRAYFSLSLKNFSIPVKMNGTPFMVSVWEALQAIPYGEKRSYSDIALTIGKPLAVRAVGMANHRNPLPIFIPCHRVIGKNGSLTGYAYGLSLKERLLHLEE